MMWKQRTARVGQGSDGFLARLKALRGNESGAIAMVFALMLPVMIGFIGLGIDVAMWYLEKRDLQTAVDSGAVAGSIEKGRITNATVSDIEDYVQRAVAKSGYNLTVGTDLFINSPPTSGRFATDGDLYTADSAPVVEVIAKVNHQTYFAAIFDFESVEIAARAVAGQNGTGAAACMVSFDDGVNITGNVDIEADDCAVHTQTNAGGGNGNDIDRNGSTGSHSFECATSTDGTITDDFTQHPNATFADGCNPRSGVSQIDNPYASIQTPSDLTCDNPDYDPDPPTHASLDMQNTGVVEVAQGGNGNGGGGSLNVTYHPGLYCFETDDDSIGNNGAINSSDIVTFEPGVYYIDGQKLQINGSATVSAEGAIFIMVNTTGGNLNGQEGTIDFSGGSGITVSGPKLDDLIDENGDIKAGNPYSDLLGITNPEELAQWADLTFVNMNDLSGNCANSITGGSETGFYGIFYAPSSEVCFSGNASTPDIPSDQCRSIIGKGIKASGNGDIKLKTCAGSGQEEFQTKVVGLVE